MVQTTKGSEQNRATHERWLTNKHQQRLMFRWITVRRQTDQQSAGKWVLRPLIPCGGFIVRQPTLATV